MQLNHRIRFFSTVILGAAFLTLPAHVSQAAPIAVAGQNHVHSILVEPNNPNDLYLGTHYRLYRSTDGGRHWHGLLPEMMLTMSLDPARPSTIYGVTLQSGMVKSTDGGLHWRKIQAGLPKSAVTGAIFDFNSHSLIGYGNGIFRSTDGGAHWHATLKGQSISNVAFGNGVAYASTGNGVYISRDAGAHWSASPSVGNQPVVQVVASGRVAYAVAPIAMLKSTDAGQTWRPLNSAPAGVEFLGISPSDANEVVGEVFGRGFVASYDGGRTWHSAESGIRDHNFNASTVRVAPSSAKIMYTGSWGVHFYASRDAGHHWTQTSTLTH